MTVTATAQFLGKTATYADGRWASADPVFTQTLNYRDADLPSFLPEAGRVRQVVQSMRGTLTSITEAPSTLPPGTVY
ncbi:hypothetical protein [Deinococcus kurensis]|uniref:hypothetical protein n=1 Tax=Deinococcus kurensis TaxID=2662757 RepID=UPI0012D30507|nr:hypothetical protein [Deinococcus kurensis]